ncbi:MAG TPA: hypothetical protein VG753_00555 [Candidatus Paceibacterota bacterium]|nr:hypothetical protein [Candidatus Paceibacterota bacterium]
MTTQRMVYLLGGIIAILLVAWSAWFLFFKNSAPPLASQGTSSFGVGDDRTITVTSSSGSDTGTNTVTSLPAVSGQTIFKISDGPVTTATLIQTFNPTTTLARYVLQENGHVFDQVLDSAGAVPRAISNTTIPGTMRGVWLGGSAVVLQYLDGATIKSVYLGFPPPATTTAPATRPVHITFLPDNIEDLASSPDGASIAYLLTTAAGADGYTAKADGSNSKKLFSMPLSDFLITWPSASTLLLQTKNSSDASGAAFSVNAQSGGIVPLLYDSGLSAIANRTFSQIVYRTSDNGGSTYVHAVQAGTDTSLSFDPIPEKCVWSAVAAPVMYCAVPFQGLPANYLDLWHQGIASLADTIFSFNTVTGDSVVVASPGTDDGGVLSDIAEMNIAPDDSYLVFIKKGDRSLWGVRLTTH